MRRFKKSELEALTVCPDQGAVEWLAGAEDSVSYLKTNAENDELVIYASAKSVLVHGVLAPTSKVTPPDGYDLQHGSFPMVDDCWAIQRVWGGGQGHSIYLEPPLNSWGSKSFEGGEKLIYRRSFTGVQQVLTPIELSQKLVHALDLYFVPERNAYCRLDRRGEIEDVIKIIQRESADVWEGLDVVTILRKDLDKFMALSETSLVLRFDFTRVRWGDFGGWGKIERYERDEPDLFYHGGKDGQGAMQTEPSLSDLKSPSMNWSRPGKMRKTRRSANMRHSRSMTARTKPTSRPPVPQNSCLITSRRLICRGRCPRHFSGRKSYSVLKPTLKDSP